MSETAMKCHDCRNDIENCSCFEVSRQSILKGSYRATCSISGLKISCIRCGDILNKQGGLLFSPPDREQRVRKIHLCRGCWELIEMWMRTYDK